MRSLAIIALAFGLCACGRKIPDEVKQTLEHTPATAIKVASDAIPICASWKGPTILGKDTPPEPQRPNPAKGTSLESEAKVYEVAVWCNWPDAKDASMASGSALARL